MVLKRATHSVFSDGKDSQETDLQTYTKWSSHDASIKVWSESF